MRSAGNELDDPNGNSKEGSGPSFDPRECCHSGSYQSQHWDRLPARRPARWAPNHDRMNSAFEPLV